jgi:hypothetical protein
MKSHKQVKALLGLLAVISILPGCGKKDNGAVAATGGPVTSVSTIGSAGCATVSYNSAVTLTFYGNLTQGYSGIVGNLSAYGYGSQSFGGSNYYRNLSTGDSVNVYVNGTTAYAVLSLATNTVNAIVMGQNYAYGSSGSAQVCGISINESIFASGISGPGYTGTMGGGQIALWGNNSWITYGPMYGNQLILF